MSEKLILGISGSPRKGANTDLMLAEALKAAETVEGIRTETIYLRDYEIHNCRGCFACCRDGMDEIYPKLKACDGLIIASPVYFQSVSAQVKQFMDRTEGLLRYGTSQYQYALQNKVGGGLVVGGNRNAGEELTMLELQGFFQVHDMIVVGSGGEPTPGCYNGGACTTYPQKGDIRDAVLSDELGMKSCRNLGIRVAKTVMMLRHA